MILDHLLLFVMTIASLITFYMTMARLFTKKYDSWIFAMCFAITLSIYDNMIYHKK
jgi:hypothetical protein